MVRFSGSFQRPPSIETGEVDFKFTRFVFSAELLFVDRGFELLAIPADAAGKKSGAATGFFPGESLGDRPIVRQAHSLPVGAFLFIAEMELPIEVEVLFDASGGGETDTDQ